MPDSAIPKFVTPKNLTAEECDSMTFGDKRSYNIFASYNNCRYRRLSNERLNKLPLYYDATKKASRKPNDFIFSNLAPRAYYDAASASIKICEYRKDYFSIWVKKSIFDDNDTLSRFWKACKRR